MATSSITKNFVVSGEKQVQTFVAALESLENRTTPLKKVKVTKVSGAEALRELMSKRIKADAK